jgi:transposase
LHIMAVVQLRHDTEGRAYFRRRVAAGKTPMEAMRALKRRLSDVVYRRLVADARKASPGGHSGAATTSSAAGPAPTAGSSDQSLPGPGPQPTPPGGPVAPRPGTATGRPPRQRTAGTAQPAHGRAATSRRSRVPARTVTVS